MSLYDYEVSKKLAQIDPPFAALIMAAMRKADSVNLLGLKAFFPGIHDELEARYNAPGGRLESDGQW